MAMFSEVQPTSDSFSAGLERSHAASCLHYYTRFRFGLWLRTVAPAVGVQSRHNWQVTTIPVSFELYTTEDNPNANKSKRLSVLPLATPSV